MECGRRSVRFPWSFRKTVANQLPSTALWNRLTLVKSIKYRKKIKYIIALFIYIESHSLIVQTRSPIHGSQVREKASHAVLTLPSAGLDKTSIFSLSIVRFSLCELWRVSKLVFILLHSRLRRIGGRVQASFQREGINLPPRGPVQKLKLPHCYIVSVKGNSHPNFAPQTTGFLT